MAGSPFLRVFGLPSSEKVITPGAQTGRRGGAGPVRTSPGRKIRTCRLCFGSHSGWTDPVGRLSGNHVVRADKVPPSLFRTWCLVKVSRPTEAASRM